ncbi:MULTISPECIES: D-ribose pyranase [unclassified Vibrio]|uniref:D-ribose pyranase n=1 Tax=Vibrio sp. HB236076 TaxID=3232307 RepID=A0AB39HI61_9VIBR|nr:D-ribose pyranase [Vibrio sp. HB161653]MDP5253147.1 D-ribose pyranase [Vibrio sp. HB161653]
MKKATLLNAEVSHLIARLGHTDEITIADAGLPIPAPVQRIDLALKDSIPSFIDTVTTVLSECQIEALTLASEMREHNPECHQQLMALIEQARQQSGREIVVHYLSHEQFKTQTQRSKAVIRTGECTPYANVIFHSGVVF